MMGFAVGVLVFTVLAYYFMGENVNLKTGLSLLLSIGIICIQVFMK
jgi:hypothetical protein